MGKTNSSTTPPGIFKAIIHLNEKKKLLWVPGEVPSLKNSKQIVSVKTSESICCSAPIHRISKGVFICAACKKNTKHRTIPRLIPSKAVQEYVENTKSFYTGKDFQAKFASWFAGKPYPIYLGMYLVRKTARQWDFNNITQIIQDLLKDYGYLADDNVDYLIPVYLGHHKNDEKPGIILIPLDNYQDSLTNYLKNYAELIV